jgi:hypothetical protein
LDSDFGADVAALGELIALAPKRYAKPSPAARDHFVTADEVRAAMSDAKAAARRNGSQTSRRL